MIPNIFISSTIADLHYLRDAIRDVVKDLGYNPVMSEYGDIGYNPFTSVVDACLNAMRDSHLAVLIIGKKYGYITPNKLSVTHNEFRVAKERNIPVICIIEKEVLSFKKVYDASKATEFPDMDEPQLTFELINEFKSSSVNNGYRTFETVNDARESLIKQIAHFFGPSARTWRYN
jgi:hypothetical protein